MIALAVYLVAIAAVGFATPWWWAGVPVAVVYGAWLGRRGVGGLTAAALAGAGAGGVAGVVAAWAWAGGGEIVVRRVGAMAGGVSGGTLLVATVVAAALPAALAGLTGQRLLRGSRGDVSRRAVSGTGAGENPDR